MITIDRYGQLAGPVGIAAGKKAHLGVALGSEFVEYEKADGVARVTLNRPESKNALSDEMYTAIARACAQSDFDPDVQVTVITGAGDTFSAGGDLKSSLDVIEQIAESAAGIQGMRLLGIGPGALMQNDPVAAIQRANKLVVAAVNGLCQGSGFLIAMVADLTIASNLATFRVPEPLRGIADPWVASRLPLYVGMERAKSIMLRCQEFTAEQALAWGFVSEVAPHDQLEERLERLLDDLLLTAPSARSAYKAAANRLIPDRSPNHPDFTDAESTIRSPDGQEGMAAFRERRQPSWFSSPRSETFSSTDRSSTTKSDHER